MALAELRALSATSYFRSGLGILGGNTAFTAAILLRELGPTASTQFICGNTTGTTGWSFVRTSDSQSGAVHNYSFTVFENNVAQTVTFALFGAVAKMMLFHFVYTGGAPGSITAYVNGIEVATGATSSNAITQSSARFSIGYNTNAAVQANPDMGFVSFGYVNVSSTSTQVAENTQASVKTQEISNSGMGTAWTNLYIVAKDSGSGTPATLRNFGTAPAFPVSTLEVVGRTSMILSSPVAYLGDSSRVFTSAGGGDVSGPGASTNNAVATWNGVTGDTLLNSVVTIAPGTGNITTPGTVDGRDISVDGTKLDGIAAGATNTQLSAVAPVNVTKAAAAVGVAVTAARSDHKHDINTAVAGAIAVGDAAAEGVATSLSRSDHVHSLAAPAAPVNVTKSAASAGVATTVARADHKHDVTTATAVSIGTANAEGVATSLSRSDHVHAHGNLLGGTLHAVATDSVAGFMSAADKSKLDAIPGTGSGVLTEVYVSDVNGNDANSGVDPANAVATLARAYLLITPIATSAVQIHLGSGTYTWSDSLFFTQNVSSAPLYLLGDGAGQVGDDGFVAVDAGVVVVGSTAINVIAGSFTTNAFAGYTLEFTTGPLIGERRTIRNNTTTALVPCSAFSQAPNTGDLWRIVKSGIDITIPEGATAAGGVGFSQIESPLVWVNLNFIGAGFTTSLRLSSCNLLAYGVTFEEGGLTCINSTIHAGTLYANASDNFGAFGNFLPWQAGNTAEGFNFLAQQLATITGNVFDWIGWGMSTLRDTDEQLPLVMDSGKFVGFLVGSQLTLSPAAKMELVGGAIIDNGQTTSGCIINNGGNLYFQDILTQRDETDTITMPNVSFLVVTGASKIALLTQNAGYTRIGALTFTTNAASTSIQVAGPGSTVFADGATGIITRGAVVVVDSGLLSSAGPFTGAGALTIDDHGSCVFDATTNSITFGLTLLTNGAKFKYQSSTGLLSVSTFAMTSGSEALLEGVFGFNNTVDITASRFVGIGNGVGSTTAFGVGATAVALTDSYVYLNYPTQLVNMGGTPTSVALTLVNSTFACSETRLAIDGRVSLTNDSLWLMDGAIGATTSHGITAFDSKVHILAGTGSFTVTDTTATALVLQTSEFKSTSSAAGTSLSLGATVGQYGLEAHGSRIEISNTNNSIIQRVVLRECVMYVHSAAIFTVSEDIAAYASKITLNVVALAPSASMALTNSALMQLASRISTGAVTLQQKSTWTLVNGIGLTNVAGAAATSALSVTDSTIDMLGVTSGSLTISTTGNNGLFVTQGGQANLISASFAITGAAAVAAVNVTMGGFVYLTGAAVAFGATGVDFIDSQGSYAFGQVNTAFGSTAAVMPGNHAGGTWVITDHATSLGGVQRVS